MCNGKSAKRSRRLGIQGQGAYCVGYVELKSTLKDFSREKGDSPTSRKLVRALSIQLHGSAIAILTTNAVDLCALPSKR